MTITPLADGTPRGTFTDREVLALMIEEARLRDQFADAACAQILDAMQGQELTAKLCHDVRMRLRKLADDVHALARVAASHVGRRERVRKHCKVDPVVVSRLVAAKVAAGMTITKAFVEVAEEMGAAAETIRNAYYKYPKPASK